ncbi:MAG: UDP-2,4-diacetamido-2,4,6-trideoxy-beta-L-altropyranose hydrolase [Deltaproteobacteria bacterium]|nr:UDP-2,4-diacetamido-2,4,6-trideoxy-beta-L-altropyranose hydrolase [Deltaproteobacteria bacterium]
MSFKVLMRVDAGPIAGYGHFMRSLALAQALRRKGHDVLFVSQALSDSLVAGLKRQKLTVRRLESGLPLREDALATSRMAVAESCRWIVMDGYSFDTEYQRLLKKGGSLLFCIDELADRRQLADIVLNQTHDAENLFTYNTEQGAVLLLGSRYALLREEFLRRGRAVHPPKPRNRNILITMGAGDRHNQAARVIEAIATVNQGRWRVKIVAGDVNPNERLLRRLIAGLNGSNELVGSNGNMPTLMTWADLAVSAGGSTCWEICFLGLPAILISTAANQRFIASSLHASGCALHLGRHEEVVIPQIAEAVSRLMEDPARRTTMSRRGREIVDGAGADRAVAAMEEFS